MDGIRWRVIDNDGYEIKGGDCGTRLREGGEKVKA